MGLTCLTSWGALTILALGLSLLTAAHAVGGAGGDDVDLTGDELPAGAMRLEELDLAAIDQEWGRAQARKSVDGNDLSIGGVVYAHGVGSHANA
jgi:hypothetical protein